MNRRAGWTLVEAVVAVGLTAVVAVAVAAAAMSFRRAMAARAARRPALAAADWMRRLSADASAAVNPGEGHALELGEAPPAVVRLRLRAARAAVDDPAAGHDGIPADLEWTAWPHPNGNGLLVVRIHRPISGPSALRPPVTNVVADPAAAFVVEVSDGTNWLHRWPDDSHRGLPAAVRATLAVAAGGGTATASVEAAVQAAVPVTSSVERRSEPATRSVR